jgi:hypothetical protein
LLIAARIVWIHVVGKVDVRTPYVQETVWIPLSELCGLVPVDDVVRHGRDAGRELGDGAKGIKRMKAHVRSTGQA